MDAVEARALGREFLARIHALPKGEKVDQCLQCGTCSASCPSAFAMDHGPRKVIAFLRAGLLDRVLTSNTMWLCVSCYSCAVRCPAGIPFTDIMYELKRLALRRRLCPPAERSAAMAYAFTRGVATYGRSHEATLLRRYFLATGPLQALRLAPMGLKLWRRGRLSLRPRRIAGIEGLQRMMAAVTAAEEGAR